MNFSAFLWKAVVEAFGLDKPCHPLYPDEKSGCPLLSGLGGTGGLTIEGCRMVKLPRTTACYS